MENLLPRAARNQGHHHVTHVAREAAKRLQKKPRTRVAREAMGQSCWRRWSHQTLQCPLAAASKRRAVASRTRQMTPRTRRRPKQARRSLDAAGNAVAREEVS